MLLISVLGPPSIDNSIKPSNGHSWRNISHQNLVILQTRSNNVWVNGDTKPLAKLVCEICFYLERVRSTEKKIVAELLNCRLVIVLGIIDMHQI